MDSRTQLGGQQDTASLKLQSLTLLLEQNINAAYLPFPRPSRAPIKCCKQQIRMTCLYPGQQILQRSHSAFNFELGGGGGGVGGS